MVLALLGAALIAAAAPPPRLHARSCTIGKRRSPATCGTFTVYEDRATGSGRTIDLRFVLLHAKHRSGRAIAWNPGGPGGSAVANAPDIADGNGALELTTLRDRYDVLLLDNRGTGGSAPLNCDFAPKGRRALYFMQTWPDELVKACRTRLAANADLNLYTTSIAADDLDDVRAALGYPKLVLDGGSYGTTFFLDYARRHSDRVESMVLDGVAPPHFLILPLEDAGGAQQAVDGLIAACASDASCSKHFPNFKERFYAVVARFDRAPVSVSENVRLSKEVFAERIRQLLYDPDGAAYLPYVIDRAYARDYEPLSMMVDLVTQGLASEIADGLNLSVTCAEDIPFITEAEVARTSAGSFEGDVRVRAQQRACAIWNVDPVAASFQEPVRSNAPVLMISGSDDPATPPHYAREAAAYLPNARIVLVKGAGHGTETPCVDKLIDAFVRAGRSQGLNVDSCSEAFKRPPFATSLKGLGN